MTKRAIASPPMLLSGLVLILGGLLAVPALDLLPAEFGLEDKQEQPPMVQGGKQRQPGIPQFGAGGPSFGPGGFMGQKRKLVDQFDRDKDGYLNTQERQAAREFVKKQGPGGRGGFFPGGPPRPPLGGALTKPLFAILDADKSGRVTGAEVTAAIGKFMTESDKDKKGRLDEEQLARGLERILPKPKDLPPPPGAPPRNAFGPSGILARAVMQGVDSDKDGSITLAELTAAAKELFQRVDMMVDEELEERELAYAFDLLPAPRFGFGPPGGKGPPPGGKGPGGKGPGGKGPGGFPGFGGGREPGKPGPRVSPAEVKNYPDANLYDTTVLRTLFLEFDNADWEQELADFNNTDVEVPCTLTVDGKKYLNVGVHFRGMSSYMGVPAGSKRSLNLALDFIDTKQRLYGYKTLNLLNSHEDPTFMHTVLYSQIARDSIPAPKANFVKVVINGESWGIYVNAQQFNKDFVKENYQNSKGGARWKVPGSPGGRGGLEYLGEKPDSYKQRYQIKSKDDAKDWQDLVNLCKVLNQTPVDRLEEALQPILDIDGALWFLALENVLINGDGYWIRASDYNIFRDGKGKFHIIPHDMNEVFGPGKGPGFGFGKGPGFGFGKGQPGGLDVDPLIGLNDNAKPLRSKLLAVPSLKAKYLRYVRTIAENWLDWKKLGPIVARHRDLIESEIQLDTRKMSSLAAFQQSTADGPGAAPAGGGRPTLSLRAFADQRREFLLNHAEVKKAGEPVQ
jgi:hypothetical protein